VTPCGRDPLDTIHFASPIVEIGSFRVDPGHSRFHDSGPIQRHVVVFPRTLVRIAHAGAEGFLAGPDLVTYYNRGQLYRRESVNGLPDRCDWFAFSPEVLADALADLDPAARDRPAAPFAFARGPGDSVAYVRQRMIVDALAGGTPLETLRVEEDLLHILARLLEAAYGARRTESSRGRPADRDLAEDARVLLGRTFCEDRPLSWMAPELGVSIFHLCRVFRREAAMTLHAYRSGLRLSAALELLRDASRDLTAIGLDLGYSSHSHFSDAFRRRFGVTPSAFRGSVSRLSASPRRPTLEPESSSSAARSR
jgi:AraC family transcriptional regulator